jgi:uncharacterized membrane protein
MKYAILLHLLGVVVWVGGMFFAYMALRPVAAQVLEPPQRLLLWAGTFRRFFPWVWVAVILILTSGLIRIDEMGGFSSVPSYIHLMFAIGAVMMAVFVYIYFVPFPRLCRLVVAQEWKPAGNALAEIRRLIGFNLSIGLINVAVAILGRAI